MSEPTEESTVGDGARRAAGDLRDLFKQFAQPMIDSLDHRLRGQIDARVDERVEVRVNELLADRLAVLERAIADLDRAVRELRLSSPAPKSSEND